MGNSLRELTYIILFIEYSDEEWIEIDKKVQELYEKASEKEKEEFLYSGAGDALAQILEYL